MRVGCSHKRSDPQSKAITAVWKMADFAKSPQGKRDWTKTSGQKSAGEDTNSNEGRFRGQRASRRFPKNVLCQGSRSTRNVGTGTRRGLDFKAVSISRVRRLISPRGRTSKCFNYSCDPKLSVGSECLDRRADSRFGPPPMLKRGVL